MFDTAEVHAPTSGVRVRRPRPMAAEPARAGDQVFRAIDLMLAVAALVFLAPVMLAVYIAVRASDGGPALFRQHRLGKGGRMFACYKFRSMVMDADRRLADLLAADPAARAEWARDQKLKCDPRITPLGRFLRVSSLDELPQLFNILRGEMSFVGPRPIVRGEAVRYGRRIDHYCRVTPGLTGLWQISGRSQTTYRRRVAADVVYVNRRTLALNMKILAATVPAVLLAKGSA